MLEGMKSDEKNIIDKALQLPPEARAALAGSLLESLEDLGNIPDETELLWQQEISRRIAALDAGKLDTLPWHEVRRQLLANHD